MWTDAIEVISKHEIISQLLACLRKIPLYKPTTFWGDDVPIETKTKFQQLYLLILKIISIFSKNFLQNIAERNVSLYEWQTKQLMKC